jgi:DNA-directed RNA polymerase specialized sigma24 family protein
VSLIDRLLGIPDLSQIPEGKVAKVEPPRPWPEPPTFAECQALLRQAMTMLANLPQTQRMAVMLSVFGLPGSTILEKIENTGKFFRETK